MFFDVAYQSYLPVLVESSDLKAANAKLALSDSGSKIVGNTIGGVLVQTVGAALAVGLDALSYLFSVLSLMLIRKQERPHEGPSLSIRQMRKEIVEGLHLVLHAPDLRRIAFGTGTSNFGGAMVGAVVLIYAYRTLHLTPGMLGLLFGLGNLGFVGALGAARLGSKVGLRAVLIGSTIVAGVGLGSILLAPLGVAPLFIGLFTALPAIAIPIYNINQVSYRQALVESRLQGRLNATMRTFVWGTLPLGSLVGGFFASVVGVQWTIAAGATICTTAAVWFWDLRERPIPIDTSDLH